MTSTDRTCQAALLGALFAASPQGVSRGKLAGLAGVTPSRLELLLAPYLEAGYPLEFHPHGAVKLLEPPDVWCAEEILGRCPPRPGVPAWDPLLLAETTSTNDIVRLQARKGAHAGFLVAASRQTGGRGRLGRSWESPTGMGLYVSLLLRPDLTARDVGRLTILSSVAVRDAVEELSGLRPQIKWPNDLLIGGRKLAGLLIEAELAGARLASAAVGIGINLRQTLPDFSPEIRDRATSLRLAAGNLFRRADLLVAILHAFERHLLLPFEETRQTWAASSLNLGQTVTLTTVRGRRHGQAMGLDETGALLLRLDSGEIEAVAAGDMQAS